MARTELSKRIKQSLFLLDGGMGSQLFARGVQPGTCSDNLNLENPQLITDIQTDYFAAGSDAVITNTFGASSITLSRHGLAESSADICIAAANIARNCAGPDRYVIGDIGPTGDFLKPLGMLDPDQLKESFAVQAKALQQGGVDGFIIETMSALDEAQIALEAIKSVSDLPIFVSFAYNIAGDDFKTMMGVGIENVIEKFAPLSAAAIGFNCGSMDMQAYIRLAEKYSKLLSNTDIEIFAEPNAGQPKLIDGESVYELSPQEYTDAVKKIHDLGVNILGGCCGTTPQHIASLAKQLKG